MSLQGDFCRSFWKYLSFRKLSKCPTNLIETISVKIDVVRNQNLIIEQVSFIFIINNYIY